MRLIRSGARAARYRPGDDVMLALDHASSGFFENGLYQLRTDGRSIGAQEMVALYAEWVGSIPFRYSRMDSPRTTGLDGR
jgi:enolase